MSRALDLATAAALKSGNPLAAYSAISQVLTVSPPDGGLLEIEILGRSHPLPAGQYVMQDSRAVGVSKLALVQAFLLARQQLREHLDGAAPREDEEVFALTAAILLFDPEYLTAANTRKRIIQARISSSSSSSGEVDPLLAREKHFVDSLLTSRLHRHTKSPVLWSHRRWLVGLLGGVDVLADLTEVVFVAGERHPRNYYAWCHARFLVGRQAGAPPPEMVAAVRRWCFQHHTDTSGWSFLGYLLARSGDAGQTFSEVLDLVAGLRLGNESVWVFLRTLAGDARLVGKGLYERFRGVQKAVLETAKTPAEQRVLWAAVEWSEAYRGTHNAGA
ncbi:hypothetical protein C8A05DRAFT_42984 [Staphylotrichum tortipilum]|uniref:Protein prenyltransferase n=1 Tax=Staphylotrichum tortipilum TaxID=2831512 RepID=A0AAN6MP78_9PEZI|nr:hypothetical protein C8A05DRAFT_42984 [Staphylotrichum longicolle]